MTEDQLNEAAQRLASRFADIYVDLCKRLPTPIVLTAMTGALAACAHEAGADRERVIAALNSCFDDIEGATR